MKILKLNYAYSTYLPVFYANNPDYSSLNYEDKRRRFFDDAFSWGDAWTHYLKPLGYDAEEVVVNEETMQLQWALENNIKSKNSIDIVIEQIKLIKPDVVWFDAVDPILLHKVKEAVPFIKVYIAWVGSAIYEEQIWKEFDLVLTCAPETKEVMQSWGVNVEHIHHGFDPRILDKIDKEVNITGKNDLIFIGQVLKKSAFHLQREMMLTEFANSCDIKVYSPSYRNSKLKLADFFKIFGKRRLYELYSVARGETTNSLLKKMPFYNKVSLWDSKPLYNNYQFDKRLEKKMDSGVYGIDMFRKIANSKITLNIHADSSPDFASNMRLFETTGVGTCLLTDWKKNISNLFEPDSEVVTYKSTDECIEKVKWLLDNESKRKEIAERGRKRTMKEHTFEKRAIELDYCIKRFK